jgi:hypothetical protein
MLLLFVLQVTFKGFLKHLLQLIEFSNSNRDGFTLTGLAACFYDFSQSLPAKTTASFFITFAKFLVLFLSFLSFPQSQSLKKNIKGSQKVSQGDIKQ